MANGSIRPYFVLLLPNARPSLPRGKKPIDLAIEALRLGSIFKMKIHRGILLAVLAIAGWQPRAVAQIAIVKVNLGSAENFAVLAGSGITVAGATNSTMITGDIGTFPTATITNLGNISLTGVNHAGDVTTQAAKSALVAAFDDAKGRSATTTYGAGGELGGLTLTSGVYNSSSTLAITGTLKLDAQGNPNAVWIFQAGSTLITAAASQITLINGAQADNIFWQVGSSATLNSGSSFEGNILASASITMISGAVADGRLLALGASVTLDTNTISAPGGASPEPAATSALIAGFFGLLIGIRRVRSIVARRAGT
jgi:hypothetical protein